MANLFDSLLRTAQSVLGQSGFGERRADDSFGVSDFGKAIIGGVLGLLLGRSKFRKTCGGSSKIRVLAALGVLAFKVRQDRQRNQRMASAVALAPAPAPPGANEHALLIAIVAVAKADSHIDA